MFSISSNESFEKTLGCSISNFCDRYAVGVALKKSNVYKQRGVPVMEVFVYLLQLVYTGKSMFMDQKDKGSRITSMRKDTVYRFTNSSFINWSRFLMTVAQALITGIDGLTSEKRLNAYVIDDTLYSRSCSKKVELMAKVHDHTGRGQKFKKGFRLLTLSWTDGNTLVPVAFRHLSSQDQKSRYREINPDIDKRSCGYKTRMEALTKAPDLVLKMLTNAKKSSLPARHVLFDCWFSSPSAILEISKLSLFTVARIKNTGMVKYLFHGEKKTAKQIFDGEKKRRGKSRYLLSAEVSVYNKQDEIAGARIVFVRDRSNRKKWIAIICTDLSLKEEEIIALYGKRWSIEVFFKICKTYLKLTSEFHQLSYDALTAHTTVVMIRYMILASERRRQEDKRTMGELFFLAYDEVADIRFEQAIMLIFELLVAALGEYLDLPEEQIDRFIDAFIEQLPEKLKRCMPYRTAFQPA